MVATYHRAARHALRLVKELPGTDGDDDRPRAPGSVAHLVNRT